MTEAQALVDGLLAHPWGQVSPSVYETGRVMSLTPWLTGHETRVAYLLGEQRPDGGWGPAAAPGYSLVPTLSAVEALLAEPGPAAARACARGLAYLHGLLKEPPELPDTPALELIAASLVHGVNARAAEGLPLPAVLDDGRYELVKAAFVAGAEVPGKLLHALEVLGPAAARLPGVRPEYTGTVGASPAATAAWLGRAAPGPHDPSRRFLETAARLHGGPVPVGLPITVFERGWVLSWLIRAGVAADPHPELVRSLTELLGPDGTPAAAGLPADADTTAGALYALALVGAPARPDVLWAYETDANFCTWPGGEDGRSVTTNAHVLEAFGEYSRTRPAARYAAAMGKVAAWLCAEQRPEGHWADRWHASPYYATCVAALALHEFGGPDAAPSVARAVRWVRETRNPDGSWGIWGGSAEETAYAVHVLALTADLTGEERVRLLIPASEHLVSSGNAHPALWHDKDLYLPVAIVRAAVLAAAELVRERVGGALIELAATFTRSAISVTARTGFGPFCVCFEGACRCCYGSSGSGFDGTSYRKTPVTLFLAC